MRKRGYNHAEILAKNIGKQLNLHVENLLTRAKETKPQYVLKRDERRENIRGAFVDSSKDQSKSENFKDSFQHTRTRIALLVDDIVTTSSTLLEAANVLKRNGFGKVYGVILAQD